KDWDLTYKEQVKLEIYGKVQSAVNPIATAPTKRKVPIREIALASVIAVSSFLFLLTYVNHGTSTKYVTKRAEAGQHATINLRDGSSVKLNAGSSITYPQAFDDDIRQVELVGEAYFQVKHQPDVPFIVKSGATETKVLGTSFNINAFSDRETRITLVEGRVAVTAADQEAQLAAGEQVVFYNPSQKLSEVTSAEGNATAWLDGVIQFQDTPLDEVVATLERWYDADIFLVDPALSQCKISGKFKEDRLVNVLEGLKFLADIEYDTQDFKQIYLSGEGCR
ncbi:MAG: FecR domain-containing protein, partial [Bacteroidota bacterium]